MPFTGYYDLTLSGTRGAGYGGDNCGGPGYTLTGRFHLNKGDVLEAYCPNAPSYSTSGSTLSIPAGNASTLKVNGTLVWTAAGGKVMIKNNIAPSGISTVIRYNGDGTSSSYSVHVHAGFQDSSTIHSTAWETTRPERWPSVGRSGCWVYHKHGLDKDFGCEKCKCTFTDGVCTRHNHPWKCGKTAGWTTDCGYSERQIVGATDGTDGTSSTATGWSATSTQNASGNGSFTFALSETANLYYTGSQVTLGNLQYAGSYADLVLVSDTVCYFKRR